MNLASSLYGGITRLRNECYRRGILATFTSQLPVISIGNITVGGNGKTPLCIYLAQHLSSLGFKPVVLLRGYGGETGGPHLVVKDDSTLMVGDEAALLKSSLSNGVVVSADRVAGAKFIASKAIGDVIILDDGFQHRRLKRDLDIVTIDVGTAQACGIFKEGRLLPFGRFREDRDSALKRADVVVLSHRRLLAEMGDSQEILKFIPSHVKVFNSFLKAHPVSLAGETVSLQKVVAFSAVASPENYYLTLQQLGLELEGTKTFPDHYRYSEDDILELGRLYPNSSLICTEKDAVKIRELKLGDLTERVSVLRTQTVVEPEGEFLEIVRSRLKAYGCSPAIGL